MQKLKIPVTLDVRKAAQHGTCYQGFLVLKQLKRLSADLTSVEGDVDVILETGIDERGLNFLKGHAEVNIATICQRCNENMNIDLKTDFAYTPVKGGYVEDEENPLPDYYEVIEVNEFGEVDLVALIEDELILSLPLIPKHDEQDCPASDQVLSFGEIEEEIVEEKPNPFAALQQLKRN